MVNLGMTHKIGLIADSHGNLPAIKNCIQYLQGLKVPSMVHLGDIFDSLSKKDLFHILQVLKKNKLSTVKGNNDFQIQNLLSDGQFSDISRHQIDILLDYLQKMPMKIDIDDICFTHSLPYNSVRSFYEPVDDGSTVRAVQIFNQTKYRVIFCGHSHSSVVFKSIAGNVTRQKIRSHETLYLKPDERYIIIVGSADNGECGIFNKIKNSYQRLKVDSHNQLITHN